MLRLQLCVGRELWRSCGISPARVVDSQMNKKYSPKRLMQGLLWFVKEVLGGEGVDKRRGFNGVLLWSTCTPNSIQ